MGDKAPDVATQGRLYKYDVVRAIAMLFVVAVHSMAVIDTNSSDCSWFYWTAQTVFFTGNALFFMMSGKFNLREKLGDVAVKRFYYNKVRNILLPIVVVFLIRTLYDLYPNWDFVQFGKNFVKNFVYGYNSMEYWFVFTLMGFLLVSPFLAHAFARLSKFETKVFIGLGLGYHFVLMILDNMGIPLGWSFLFSGFAFTFCLGFLVEGVFTSKKQFWILEILAVTCLVVTVLLMSKGFTADVHDQSPFYTILAVGIYLGILRWGEGRKKPSGLISFIAKHSFSIYLVHMMVLVPVVKLLPPVKGALSIAYFVVVAIFVFSASLLLAAALDTFVLGPLKKLFDKIARGDCRMAG